jgi:hypothetical protein
VTNLWIRGHEVSEPSFCNVDDLQLVTLVREAQGRLVFAAPGVSLNLSQELGAAWLRLGKDRVAVVLDADPAACRLGYGTEEGLKHLHGIAAGLGAVVCHQPNLRIGVVMTERQTVVYSPMPLLVEANRPSVGANGIALQGTPPAELARDLGVGPNGVAEQTIGLDALSQQQISKLADDLKKNPPLPFDVSRQVMVFNAKLEFVEFSVAKIQVERIDVPIPPALMGLADTALRTLFRFDPGQELAEAKNDLEQKKRDIDKQFTRPAKGFGGSLIERGKKDAFLLAVEEFRADLERFRQLVERQFDSISRDNQTQLMALLLPAILKKPPTDWMTASLTEQQRANVITDRLRRELTGLFQATRNRVLSEMRVTVLFKGITYECLNSQEFIDVARRAFPHLDLFHDEYQALPETRDATVRPN